MCSFIMTGIGMMNMITSIAKEMAPRAIVAPVRASTHFNRKGAPTSCTSGLHEMLANSTVTSPATIPTSMSTWHVRRSHSRKPKVRMKKASSGILALKMAQFPDAMPTEMSCPPCQ